MLQTCPDPKTLRRFILGQLAAQELDSLAGHVETCRNCVDVLSRIQTDDPLLDAMQKVEPVQEPLDVLADQLVQKLIELNLPVTAIRRLSAEETPSESPTLVDGDDLPPGLLAAPLEQGDLGRLGQFRVLRVLGRGGMGIVFLGEDTLLKRKVALKAMLSAQGAKGHPRQRLLREAQTVASLEHDHIVRVHTVGEEGGVLYLAMQLLEGESLEDRLKRLGRLPVTEVIRIGREIALGLAAAHDQGLIHRDIKPANIWLEVSSRRGTATDSTLDSGGRVKILDFGLARIQTDPTRITQSGTIVGTPAFMAPEQASSQPVDTRCDLFSLGCVLYRLATGELAFKGQDTMAVLMALVLHHPSPPSKIVPDLPPTLSDLIMQLLQKDPVKRPASAHAVAEALAGMLAPPPRVESCPPVADVKPSGLSDSRRRRYTPWIVAVIAGVLLLGCLAAYQLVFKTENGTLIVEVDGDADVRFQKGELRIFDSDGKLKYTLKPSEKNKPLPPGKYLVEVAGVDGLKVVTDKFEIIRGDKATVRVTVDAAAVAGKPDTASNPYRRLAELVLRRDGGGVTLDDWRVIDSMDKLPKQPFKLVGVSGNPIPADSMTELLARLKELPDGCLHTLYLNNYRPVTEEDIETLAKLPSLKEVTDLHLYNIPITDTQLRHLRHLSKVSGLVLNGPAITGDGMKVLRDSLAVTAYLQIVNPAPGFTEDGLQYLNPGLSSLLLVGQTFGDVSLAHVGNVTNLERLEIQRGSVTDEGLKHLHGLGKLQFVQLAKTPKVTRQGIEALHKALPACTIVWDGGTLGPETSADAERRVAEWVLKRGGQVSILTPDGKATHDLKAASQLPPSSFKVSHVFNSHDSAWKFNDEDLQQLAPLTSLENLSIYGPTEITDKGVERFTQSPAAAHLRWIRFINGGSVITDAGVAHLRRCPELEHLDLGYCKVSDRVLDELQGLDKLWFIGIGGGNLSDAALKGIDRFPKLTQLLVNSPMITGACVRHLKKLTTLHVLNLNYTSVDDASLVELAGLSELVQIELHGTKVTADGVQKLSAALPGCKISWGGGTIEPKTSLDVERRALSGLKFDGKSDYVEIPTLQLGSETSTVEAIATVHSTSNSVLIHVGGKCSTGLLFGSDNWAAMCYRDGGSEGVAGVRTVKQNTRVHVAIVRDANGARLYIEGKQYADSWQPNEPAEVVKAAQESPSVIGGSVVEKRVARPPAFFGGIIHGVRISTAARYQKDFAPPSRFGLDQHTLALYQFDEGHGDKLSDSSGNGHHGKIVGAKWVKAKDASQSDPERQVAEWVLSMGEIGLNQENADDYNRISWAKELPAGPLRITAAVHHKIGSNADLQRLQPLQNLTHLYLVSPAVNDDGLVHLKSLTKLRDLSIEYAPITDAGLVHLKGFADLRGISLPNAQITDEGLQQLVALPRLESVCVGGTDTGDRILDLLKTLPRVVYVYPGKNFTNEGLGRLKALHPELQHLGLQKTKVTDAGLEHLQGWHNLIHLSFWGPGLGSSFGDAGMAHLAGLKNLQHADLKETRVTDAGLIHVKGWEAIERIELSGTTISDAGLDHLTGLKNLHRLDLMRTKVTAEGVKKLSAARPECRIFWDDGVIEPQP